MLKKSINNLVSQYLENISRKALEGYQDIIKKYVRDRHGVYALYHKNKLYYVGLASNLRSRLRHHLRDRHADAWDSFSVYLTIGGQHLHELETLLLRIIDRKGNKQRGRFGKADDLKRKFRKELKRAQSEELEQLFCYEDEKRKTDKGFVPNKTESKRFVLASFVTRRFHIRFRYKDKLYIAHVRRDGSITFAKDSAEVGRLQGKVFLSPSRAAKAVTKREVNGWAVWTYERAPGDWVPLDELRKK